MSTISIGSTNVLSAFKGTTAIKSVYRGAVKLRDFFSPLNLFANGEQGVWYEPSATTAFRSTTDLTPCGHGESCGFLLDKSQGAGYSGGSFTGTTELVTNGGFEAGTSGWTFSPPTGFQVIDGKAYVTSPDAVVRRITQAIPTTAGWYYLWEFDYEKNDCNRLWITAGTSSGSGNIKFSELFAASGHYFALVQAQGPTTYFDLGVYSPTGCTGIFDNVSVKELPGNHATQTTLASRPILARVPATGRRNLLERTEEFDNAYWLKYQATAPAVSITTPAGTLGGNKFTESVATDAHALYETSSLGAAGQTYTFSTFVKSTGDSRYLAVRVFRGTNDYLYYIFNADTGQFTQETAGVSSTYTNVSRNIESFGNGWYRISLTFTQAATSAAIGFQLTDASTVSLNDIGAFSYTGDGSSGIYLWGAQLEAGSTATAYQKVVSEYDITEAGVDSLDYLSFDGTDDVLFCTSAGLVSGLNGSDVTMFMGVGDQSTINFANEGAGDQYIELQNLTTEGARAVYRNTGFGASALSYETPSVIGGFFYASAKNALVRRNGTEGTVSPASNSTVTTGTRLALGALGRDTLLYYEGKVFGALAIDRLLVTAEISNTETYLANRVGFSAPTITGVPTIGVS